MMCDVHGIYFVGLGCINVVGLIVGNIEIFIVVVVSVIGWSSFLLRLFWWGISFEGFVFVVGSVLVCWFWGWWYCFVLMCLVLLFWWCVGWCWVWSGRCCWVGLLLCLLLVRCYLWWLSFWVLDRVLVCGWWWLLCVVICFWDWWWLWCWFCWYGWWWCVCLVCCLALVWVLGWVWC